MLESCRIFELELILCAVAEESSWFPFLALGHQMQLCCQNKKKGLINLRKLTLKALIADSNEGLGDSRCLRLTVLWNQLQRPRH